MAGLKDYKPLRLMASDGDDLSVISACLQDGVAKLGDFAYLPEQRRFAFVINRFVWEVAGNRRAGPFVRVRAGVHFDDVLSVQQQYLKADANDAVVNLLAVRFEPGEEGGGDILFDFAGGGVIRLVVESVNAFVSDISEPWRTRNRPEHDIEN